MEIIKPKIQSYITACETGAGFVLAALGLGGFRGAGAIMMPLSWSEPWQTIPPRGDTLRDISHCVYIYKTYIYFVYRWLGFLFGLSYFFFF